MHQPQQTVLYDRHVALNAQIVEFGGWQMPMQYPSGIVQEHLTTRKHAGLFDVSHMGRFIVRGRDATPFLQVVLSNNAADLPVGKSHYTLLPTESGGAIDDAYLYRFHTDQYVLVVNASNRLTDWNHFQTQARRFSAVELVDRTHDMAMISLQGPKSHDMLTGLLTTGNLPDAARNALSIVTIREAEIWLARTGYTGEPICFELFTAREHAGWLWDLLLEKGAQPIGLGARDTLRLEAGLPLYGHELGRTPDSREIPILAVKACQFAVKLQSERGDFIGRTALEKQVQALKRFKSGDLSQTADLPLLVKSVALLDKGIARAGCQVLSEGKAVGYITSGTMVPYWKPLDGGLSEETGKRAIALALLNSTLREGDEVTIDIRGKMSRARIVPTHLNSKTPPYAQAVVYE